jgi:hypothetical protein
MITLAVEEALIPATAGLHIAHANQRLWLHTSFVAQRLINDWQSLIIFGEWFPWVRHKFFGSNDSS